VKNDFTKRYAISRRNSKVTARQFRRFCREIGAPLEPADADWRGLFNRALIEEVFVAQEHAFDATALGQWARDELRGADVEVALGTRATGVCKGDLGELLVTMTSHGASQVAPARHVFNCTHSVLQQIGDGLDATRTALKHEITEMPLLAISGPLSQKSSALPGYHSILGSKIYDVLERLEAEKFDA
jgi:hypothetical protein